MPSHKAFILLCLSCMIYHCYGQDFARITQYIEEVVKKVGSSAFLNCTVSSTQSNINNILVEWVFLNATDGGKSISLDCKIIEEHNVVAGQEKYELFCDNMANSVTRYALRVNSLAVPDNGLYECRVRLSNQPDAVDSVNVPLTVLSPPKIIFSSSDVVKDAFLGTNVSLVCNGQGTPAPNITWGKANGKPLPAGRYSTVRTNVSNTETRTQLSLYNLTKEDRGTYRCVADNNVRPPEELFSLLSIEFKPSVSVVEPTYGSPTGENTQIMIWCKVEGNPVPAMSWYAMTQAESQLYDDGLLELDERFFSNAQAILTDDKYSVEQKIMTVGSLSTMESMFYSLTLLTVEPADMVYFVCKAENTHGHDAIAVQLYRINTLAQQLSASRRIFISIPMTMTVLLASYFFS